MANPVLAPPFALPTLPIEHLASEQGCPQGRFWRDSFGTLNLPHSSLDKFLFEDGSPRVGHAVACPALRDLPLSRHHHLDSLAMD